MKKHKNLFITVAIILFCVAVAIGVIKVIPWLFSLQYNSNGISHFLVVTIDENQPREYMGELENHKIYIEKFNIEGTNFRTIDAENISIKEAIDKKIVSIEEWRKYSWKNKKDGETEILQFENYEIACTKEECIIRPLYR